MNKIEGWSRDGSAKKYINKICRDNVSHPLYIPMLAFLDYLLSYTSDSVCKVLLYFDINPWAIPACAPYVWAGKKQA